MDRFDGYNRHDFYYPRSTKEAFGSDFQVDDEPNHVKDFALWGAYIAGAVIVILLT